MSSAMEYLEGLQLSYYSSRHSVEWLLSDREEKIAKLTDPDRPQRRRTRELAAKLLKLAGFSEEEIAGRLVKLGESNSELDALGYDRSKYSQYEDPVFATIIDPARRIAEEAILGAARTSGKHPQASAMQSVEERMRSIAFGSLPEMSLNASAIRVPYKDEYVVTINLGLPRLLARLARVIVRTGSSVPKENFYALDWSSDEWQQPYLEFVLDVLDEKENQYLQDNYVAAFSDYLGLDTGVRYDHEKFVDLDREFSEVMTMGAEVFVIAHELNHVLDNHFVRWSKYGALPGSPDAEVGERDARIEHAADIAGLGAVVYAAENRIGATTLSSPSYGSWLIKGVQHFFFTGFTIDMLEEEAGLEVARSSTHPPTVERSNLLAALMHNRDPEFSTDFDRYAMVHRALVLRTIAVLVEAIRKRGHRL